MFFLLITLENIKTKQAAFLNITNTKKRYLIENFKTGKMI